MSTLIEDDKLTHSERVLFFMLRSRVGQLVRRNALEDALNSVRPKGVPPSENSNVLEVLISRIRKKLPPGATLKSVRGFGYMLEVVANCDSCDSQPATHHNVLAAGGTQTAACDDCLGNNNTGSAP